MTFSAVSYKADFKINVYLKNIETFHNLYNFINYLRNTYKDFLSVAFLEFKIVTNFYYKFSRTIF